MTIETRVRNTNFPPSGGGGSSNSGGLAGTGGVFLLNSGNSLLPNSLILKAGSSVTLGSDATAVYITAITSLSAGSGGLAGTGGLYVVTSASPLLPNSRILTAGSSVTIVTDGTSIYISALTSGGSGTPGGSDTQIQVNSQNVFAGFQNLRWIASSNSLDLNTAGRIRHGGVAEVDGVAPTGVTGLIWLDTSASSFTSNSAGLAGTGPYYVLASGNAAFPSGQVLTAGSSIIVRTGGGNIYIDAQTGGGGASQYKEWNYYAQIGSSPGLAWDRLVVANMINAGGLTNTVNIPVDTIAFVPLLITKSVLIDKICLTVITTAANCVLRIGLYTNSGDTTIYPLQSIATTGVVSGTNIGINTFSTVQTLTANTLYWLVMQAGTQSVTVRGSVLASCSNIFGADSGLGNVMIGQIRISQVFSNGLPSSVQAGGTLSNAVIPALAIRLSA